MDESTRLQIKQRLFKAFAKYGFKEIEDCRNSCEHYSKTTLMLHNMIQSVDSISKTDENFNLKYINLVYDYVDKSLNQMGA